MNEPRTFPGTTPEWRRAIGLALLISTLGTLQLACATSQNSQPLDISGAPESLRAGLDLYSAHEYARAGALFREAAQTAQLSGDRDLAHRATIAECTAWVRARRLEELCSCTENLRESQRRTRSTDPRANTLIAMGAIAGGRPAPSLQTPRAVRAVLRGAAEER